jgi:hypothetical protein
MKKIFLLILFIITIFSFPAKADTGINQVSNININRNAESAKIFWIKPVNINFDKAIIFRSDILIEDYFSFEAIEAFCDKIYEGQEENFADSGLAQNLSYYYVFFTKNRNNNYSKAVVIKSPAYEKNDFEENASQTNQLANANSQIVNEVSFHEAGIIYNFNKEINEAQNSDSSRLALFIMIKSPHDLKTQDKQAISYFIDSGTPTTIVLGVGERAGVLNSYLSVFDKLPRDVLEWQDVIKIANGRWPDERNIDSE